MSTLVAINNKSNKPQLNCGSSQQIQVPDTDSGLGAFLKDYSLISIFSNEVNLTYMAFFSLCCTISQFPPNLEQN